MIYVPEALLGAYWFLNTLFGASLLFYACRRWTGAKWGLAILTAGTAVCLLLMPYADAVRIVFRMFFAGAYMTLGYLFAGLSFGTKGVRGMAVIAALGTMVGVGAVFLLYGLPIEHLSALPVLEEQAAEGWWVVYVLSGVMVVCLNENHVPMIHRIMNKK